MGVFLYVFSLLSSKHIQKDTPSKTQFGRINENVSCNLNAQPEPALPIGMVCFEASLQIIDQVTVKN